MSLTLKRLYSVLTYNPETGAWTRNATGKPVGSIDKSVGYICIGLDGEKYWAHRLAWFWMTGDWPPLIEHEDTDGLNNRWDNLREGNKSLNGANRGPQKNSKSGLKGVSFCKTTGRYRADIMVRGKRLNLGRRDTAEEAGELYAEAAKKHFGEFARVA